jgi:uncharacterized protein YecT (DUF1311 family)
MNKRLRICLCFYIFFTGISFAQIPADSLILNNKKIDFENLKQISDSFYHKSIDCDSIESTLEKRYCLNIQLQKEDSLLKKRLNNLIANENDALFTKQLEMTQEIWERYRYAHCQQCLGKYGYDRMDIFSFMKCAIELTIKRREDIEKICDY